MEAFYDSDEDVCWGPVTLREVKRDLRKPIPSYFGNIDRRRTIGFNTPPKKVMEIEEPVIEDMQDIIEDVSKISIQSQYFTPDETMKSDYNFVEKVSHILNDTSLDAKHTSFVTAPDVTNSLSSETLLEDLHSIISPPTNNKTIQPSPVPTNIKTTNDIFFEKPGSKCEQYFYNNLTNIGKDIRPSCLIDNFQATLLDISDSSDEDFHRTLDNIIEKLEEDEYSDDLNKLENRKKSIEDIRYQGMESKYEDISENYDNSLKIDESQTVSTESSDEDIKVINEPSKEDDYISNKSQEYSIILDEECKDMSEIYEDEKDRDASEYSFNDTLEEMERALQMGLDYSMSTSKVPKPTCVMDKESDYIMDVHDSRLHPDTHRESELYHVDSLYHKPQSLKHITYDSVIPKSFKTPIGNPKSLPQSKPSSSKQFETKLRPLQNYKYNNIMSPVSAYINNSPKDVKPANLFKIPPKVINRSPLPKYTTLSFKSIESPVAVYIKNAPTVPLQQNVQKSAMPRFLPKSLLSPAENRMHTKENMNLPDRMYKPAKKLMARKEVRKLPGYIEKLIPNKTEIVKHEGRIHNAGRVIMHHRLIDNDLSMVGNASLLSCSSQDISVLTSKPATID